MVTKVDVSGDFEPSLFQKYQHFTDTEAEAVIFYSSELATIGRRGSRAFPKTRRKVHRSVFRERICSFFIHQMFSEYELDDPQLSVLTKKIEKIVAHACFNLGARHLLRRREVSLAELRRIQKEIIRSIVSVGNPLPFRIDFTDAAAPKALLLNYVLHEVPTLEQLAHKELVKAVYWKKNSEFLKQIREGVQETLKTFFHRVSSQNDVIKEKKFGSHPHLPMEAAVGNLLALYTYLDPPDNENISVPQKIEEIWKLIDYRIEKLQLTPDFLSSPMHAFGLSCIDSSFDAPPLLLFKGTTYPTDNGAFLSILSDVNPFASVGEYVFFLGREKLRLWIEKNTVSKRKMRVYGSSLGGSMSLQAAIAFPELIEKVHAFSPPALSNRHVRKWNKLPKIGDKPEIYVYCGEGDMIPHFGSGWGEDWGVFHVIGSKTYNPLISHFKIFTAERDVLLLDLNKEKDRKNVWRRLLSTAQLIGNVPIFCTLVAVFTCYLLLKKIAEMLKFIGGLFFREKVSG